MRVISGIAKGLILVQPKGNSTKPTRDNVKESMFNLIDFFGKFESILDLFAGSGSLGIEALSRGCEFGVFVDRSIFAIESIKTNLKRAKFENHAKVIRSDSIKFLKKCMLKFDVIFLDPPYSGNFLNKSLDIVRKNSILNEDGLIVIESELNGEKVSDKFVLCLKTVKYGRNVIYICRLKS
ncbi:MAG: 16S rRNA (guanine(966)-N(2))-methyltransferase RsmD [Clostridiales bacterium]|jgi:16S rRNA (guanine(966)-N(2))-methyltransferase RsmD|nr:16S rRNA (guanine(966)-N(2))-methyltransferase RsmD [Clostridiales bacterium]